jgi:Flp pilus assembly protein TadB
VPISMTDAFGCDRCHHIFTVDEKHCHLQQLSTLYAGKKAWFWNGSQWKPAQSGIRDSVLAWLFLMLPVVLLMIGLLILFKSGTIQILWVTGIVGLILLFLRFVLYRH